MLAIALEHVSKRFRKVVLRTGYTTLKTSLTQLLRGDGRPAEYVEALSDISLSISVDRDDIVRLLGGGGL